MKKTKFSNWNNYLMPGVIFIIYIVLSGYTMLHHELWGDEIHSWNIAKASGSFFDLISNTRYEGHPPVWYTILWTISKFTHDPHAIQYVHLGISCMIVFVVLFYSPFPLSIKAIIPFGYYFLFEYSILSRNYSIGILIAFLICIIINKNFKGKILLYYFLLLLLSNSHLFSLLLAASLHLYFLMLTKEKNKSTRSVFNHLIAGILIFLQAIYFIFPPSDSSLGTGFWLNKWNIDNLSSIIQAPVRAFIPIPDWTDYHFWDTQFLISKGHFFSLPMWCVLLISAGLILLCITLLKSDKKSLYFFLFNLFLITVVSFVIPFTNSRHVGFIFISLLIALWFYLNQRSLNKIQLRVIFIFLALQLIGGIIPVSRDIKYPFSNGYKINELLKEIPGEKIVTDYWCLNNLATFTDKSFYCVETQKEQVFLLWNSELDSALKKSDRYSSGILTFMKKEAADKIYLLSTQRLEKLQRLDEKLFSIFSVRLFDDRDGSIEKGGDLYLYEIKAK